MTGEIPRSEEEQKEIKETRNKESREEIERRKYWDGVSRKEWEEATFIKTYELVKSEIGHNQPTKEELRHLLEGVSPKEEIKEEVFDEAVKKFREIVNNKIDQILFEKK